MTECSHVELSPGQMCWCMDTIMWQRLAIELLCRRVAALEDQAQGLTHGKPHVTVLVDTDRQETGT